VTFVLTVIFDLVVAIAVGVAIKVLWVLLTKLFKKTA
jgi:MFS superfamily sulfate permease-like transporter